MAYDDSLRQFPTSSRDKTHEKNFRGPNLGQTDQNRAELRSLALFSSLVS